MLLPGAEALGLTHSQCLGLLESADDTLDFLNASLAYLIHAESQQAQPDFRMGCRATCNGIRLAHRGICFG